MAFTQRDAVLDDGATVDDVPLGRRQEAGVSPAQMVGPTGQGGRLASLRFTGVLKDAGIRISMDGRGRWMDNAFVERSWRLVK